MHNIFRNWIKEKRNELLKLGVIVEICDFSNEKYKESPDPAQRIYLDTDFYTASICVWESGQMDVQIINISTGEQILYDYKDNLGKDIDFNIILKPYIDKIVEYPKEYKKKF
ncbi:immunity protein TriTu family protein [Clostridium beijerinckii]|uniref:immunity protein TriTu family protein n=1 Tax=Clostridium beijerinckii TaxID=1520 RepID=UPI00098C0EDF|nr:hypothetical protein [Clostridium beijerinckii]MBA8932907.1 hypothetical protein [Clostridium beijerinckii]NRU37110.1 hypothetical protein [Clostridium beijerinckii]NSA99611.1 hypothetical protein [Clostridium beijerinckii]OOM57164.1 hypothetical protein CLOBI_41660 [Clostridium beijerinckii]OOM67792.1 hypothetical protein CLBEIC_39090 [Clostridium beijerinckii]